MKTMLSFQRFNRLYFANEDDDIFIFEKIFSIKMESIEIIFANGKFGK